MSILNAGDMQLCAISVSLRGENDFCFLSHTIPTMKMAVFLITQYYLRLSCACVSIISPYVKIK